MYNNRIKKTVLMLMILCASVWTAGAAGEKKLTVERIGQIVCYGENSFRVNAPEAGKITITVSTDTSVYRTIEAEVAAGKNTIEWDGLGFNQERFYAMTYHIDASLDGESGKNYRTRFDSPIERCTQAMTMALSSSDTIYLDHPKEWFLECKVILSGTLVIEMIPEGGEEITYTFRRPVQAGRINRLTFAAIVRTAQVDPGRYTMRIYEMSSPRYFKEISVAAEAKKPETPKVSVTGKIMPEEGDSDDVIWEMMMQPAVVVDIKNTNHQVVYEQPDESSGSLGTLHGQTQALCVLEIMDNWARIEAWNHEEGEKITGWVPLEKLKVEYPRTEYGLLISKKAQTMTVFREGKPIDTILICTGRMEKNQLYQETAAGSFLTGEHRVDYSTNGKKYDFVIQYDGGNLIHQIPYAFGEGKKDFTEGQALLGTKASHACVRLQAEPGTGAGVNAYWIWTHIPYHTRVIIMDDPDERLTEKQMISGTYTGKHETQETLPEETEVQEEGTGKPAEGAAADTAGNNTASGDEKDSRGSDTVVMTFGGDAVLGGREWYYRRDDSLMAYVDQYGMGYPFSGLQDYFSTDDLTSVNLECVLKADGSGEKTDKEWRFRGLPEYTGILTAGSVELVNIANNHTIDYGEAGYQATIQAIDGVVAWCGRNHPVAVDVKGHLIGFGGCRETTYRQNPEVIERDIQILKDMGCEFIVYQCHWGTEYDPHFNALQQTMAHACVRAGANLVIGHHPHVVQGMDYIGDVPVIYSLGNLCFGGTIDLDERGFEAILVRAEITFGEGKPETSVRIIPIWTSSKAAEGINDFCPVPAEGIDAVRIRYYVQRDSGVKVPK